MQTDSYVLVRNADSPITIVNCLPRGVYFGIRNLPTKGIEDIEYLGHRKAGSFRKGLYLLNPQFVRAHATPFRKALATRFHPERAT